MIAIATPDFPLSRSVFKKSRDFLLLVSLQVPKLFAQLKSHVT